METVVAYILQLTIAFFVIRFLVNLFKKKENTDYSYDAKLDPDFSAKLAEVVRKAKEYEESSKQNSPKVERSVESIKQDPNYVSTRKALLQEIDKRKKQDYEAKRKFEERFETREDVLLKAKGDRYERYIGDRFEEKGDLVIYNGFIRAYADGGVDIASISPDSKTVNLIQCKHWSLKTLELDHIETIYEKLNTHNLDFLWLDSEQIFKQLSIKKTTDEIEAILVATRIGKLNLPVRKTLYISSDKVVNLAIGEHLKMIQPNIFRYRDMKIVVEKYR
jgi:hypothetical protein